MVCLRECSAHVCHLSQYPVNKTQDVNWTYTGLRQEKLPLDQICYLLQKLKIVIGKLGLVLIDCKIILSLIWENDSMIYLLNSHSRYENGNLSSFGTTVLLEFDTLRSLENCIKFVYSNTYPMALSFQLQFIKFTIVSVSNYISMTWW